MRLTRPPAAKRQGDSTIALINIVFLMLIFFLIAGTLAPPIDTAIDPVASQEAVPAPPPDALAISVDGAFSWRGQPILPEEIAAKLPAQGAEGRLRVVVDKNLPAPMLIERIETLRSMGLADLMLITERKAKAAP